MVCYCDSAARKMVGAAGLEPATLCLEGRCSIHLSYAPETAAALILNHSQKSAAEFYFPITVTID
jgi:hypothetical protein